MTPPDQEIPEAREAARDLTDPPSGMELGEAAFEEYAKGLISTACREYAKREIEAASARLLNANNTAVHYQQQLSSLQKENEKLKKSISHSTEANRAWLAEFDVLKARAEKAEKAQQEAQSEMLAAMVELTTLREDMKPLLSTMKQFVDDGYILEPCGLADFLSKHAELK